jgi:cytochrome P450
VQTFPYELVSSDDGDAVAAGLLVVAPVVRARMPDGKQVWLALSHGAVRQVLSDATFSRLETLRRGCATKAIRQIRAYLGKLAAARRAEPGHNLITELIDRADSQDALNQTELLANLQLLLIAGHETTANQLSNSLLTPFHHPDQLALLQGHPELTERAVKELMRYVRLTVPMVATIALHDVEVTDVPITADDAVITVNPAANRDPTVFADPDRLDLTPPNTSQHAATPTPTPSTRRQRNRTTLAHHHPHLHPHRPTRHLVALPR